MASIYDRTNNVYFQDYREVTLSNSGWFKLIDEDAKIITIYNESNYAVNIAKTSEKTDPGHTLSVAQQAAYTTPIVSGTALVTGRSITVEDGNWFEVKGISNGNQVSFRKALHTSPSYNVKYIIEK